jgi:hypothetical protein
MMLLGMGLAFFFGKPFIQPVAPDLPAIPFGWWSDIPQLEAALRVNVLFLIGAAAAVALWWMFRSTRRRPGDPGRGRFDRCRPRHGAASRRDPHARHGGGRRLCRDRWRLSVALLPGSWNEGISSGQGLMAVALVIFARWNPIACFWAALLFGGAGALGPALQSVGVSEGYYLFYRRALRPDAWRPDRDLVQTQAMVGAPGRTVHHEIGAMP